MSRIDLREAAQAHRPAIQVDPSLRSLAIGTWRARMINEYRSGDVFEALADQLVEAELDEASIARCREFAREERHHGVLCGAVVEALGGAAEAELPADAPVPEHADVPRQEAALRNLISVCCLSETIAVALIGLERDEMPDGPLRVLLTTIWADECGHANFGWRRIGALIPEDAEGRRRVEDYLAVAFAHLEQHELAHFPERDPPPGGEAVGLCKGSDARLLLQATVEQVIIPALTSHGLDAERAWARRLAFRGALRDETRARAQDVRRAAVDG